MIWHTEMTKDQTLYSEKPPYRDFENFEKIDQLEKHGCVLSTLATDALVLKHQAISAHSADHLCIVLDQFQ